jgi:hypothetical protein
LLVTVDLPYQGQTHAQYFKSTSFYPYLTFFSPSPLYPFQSHRKHSSFFRSLCEGWQLAWVTPSISFFFRLGLIPCCLQLFSAKLMLWEFCRFAQPSTRTLKHWYGHSRDHVSQQTCTHTSPHKALMHTELPPHTPRTFRMCVRELRVLYPPTHPYIPHTAHTSVRTHTHTHTA